MLLSANLFYNLKKQCPLCESTFFVAQLRSRLPFIRQEADFNRVYAETNPLYLSVWLCPNCGYTAQGTFFDAITDDQKRKLRNFLKKVDVKVAFPGGRSREQAIELFKVAIYYAELMEVAKSRIAGLYLRLAWLYREAEDHVMENLALERSLHYYEQALRKDAFPVGNMTEFTVEYLIAQLYYHTGNLKRAVNGLQAILSNPSIKEEQRILRMARTLWENIKIDHRDDLGSIDESNFVKEEDEEDEDKEKQKQKNK